MKNLLIQSKRLQCGRQANNYSEYSHQLNINTSTVFLFQRISSREITKIIIRVRLNGNHVIKARMNQSLATTCCSDL